MVRIACWVAHTIINPPHRVWAGTFRKAFCFALRWDRHPDLLVYLVAIRMKAKFNRGHLRMTNAFTSLRRRISGRHPVRIQTRGWLWKHDSVLLCHQVIDGTHRRISEAKCN